jgi:DNA processing protein
MDLAQTSKSASPEACPDCLRRAHLLAHLAPYLERHLSGKDAGASAQLLCLSCEQLAVAVAPDAARRLLGEVGAMRERSLRASLEVAGCWASCPHDSSYPTGLRDMRDAPRALIGRGNPALLEDLLGPARVVTIIGARRASSYGREVAHGLGRDLAEAGITVVSGMAFGIDACAHRGALEAGRTVAVLGCGPDVAYPAAHRSLWRRIQEHGAVVSELPPGTGAWRWAFPARSRILAALSGMTVVVEAAERSASLVAADLAADLGRVVGAVPGPVGARVSAGPNGLIAEGALLVRQAEDVLELTVGRIPGLSSPISQSGPTTLALGGSR